MARDAGQVELRRPREADEIADNDNQAAGPGDATQHGDRLGQRRFLVGSAVIDVGGPVRMRDQFVHIAQRRLATQPRPQFAVTGIAEHDTAQTIAAVVRGPGQQRGRSRTVDGFEAAPGREMHIGPQVGHDQDRTLALFAEQLGIGLGAARRNSPVDVAWIVPGLVGTRLVELHAPSLEMRDIGARLQGIDTQYVQRERPGRTAQPDQSRLRNADRRGVCG